MSFARGAPFEETGMAGTHVFGCKNDELGVVNLDGTASHGSKVRPHDDDVAELRRRGYRIPAISIVEWVTLASPKVQLLIE
jgi:hypothetical protein